MTSCMLKGIVLVWVHMYGKRRVGVMVWDVAPELSNQSTSQRWSILPALRVIHHDR